MSYNELQKHSSIFEELTAKKAKGLKLFVGDWWGKHGKDRYQEKIYEVWVT